jgi:hypothetical protein
MKRLTNEKQEKNNKNCSNVIKKRVNEHKNNLPPKLEGSHQSIVTYWDFFLG